MSRELDRYFVNRESLRPGVPHGASGIKEKIMKKAALIIIIIVFSANLIGTIINVNSDGSGDYTIIQQGIEVAVDEDTVLVAPGIYQENINFLGKKITVASQYIISGNEADIEGTVIDGGGVDTVVRMDSGEDTLSYLCGFVIRNGNNPRGGGIRIYQSGAKLENLKIRENHSESENYPYGGGIFADGDYYMEGYRQIVLRNVEIDNNTVIGNNPHGGGFYFRNKLNPVILENVTVTNNHCEGNSSAYAGGGFISRGSNVSIRNCVFNDNSVSGYNDAGVGGLYLSYIDELLIDNCQIINNSVESDWSVIGGMSIKTEGNAIIRNTLIAYNSVLGYSSSGAGGCTLSRGNFLVEDCEVRGNSAEYYNGSPANGGGFCFSQNCNIIINRSLIHENIGSEGAGIGCSGSDCLLINSIVCNNQSTYNGGMKISYDGSFRIVNSIFWNNGGNEFLLNENTDLQIYHSLIEEGEDGIECINGGGYFWGEGNLDIDPMFVDVSIEDFHLQDDSPGIDSGVNICPLWETTTYQVPSEEIIGKNRDIGIYETGDEEYHFDLPLFLSTEEDISLSFDLEDYMEGMNGELSASCENYLVSVIVGNIISWQPDENWFGFDEVWIEFATDTGETYSDYILIEVTSINDAPIIDLPQSISFNNIGYYRFNVMQYISDIEQQMISISATGSEHIEVWAHYPVVSFYAEQGWLGTETITVYAEDESNRLISSDTMQVEVYCEPIAVCCDDIFSREGEEIILDGSASLDPLLNGLSYFWSTESDLDIENADSVLAIIQLPDLEEMAEALIYLEISDGYNSSIDSLYLTYWDDEPQNVECDIYPASSLIRIYWDEPAAAGCEHIELTGYQMYFEGCEYDTLQNTDERIYSFELPEGEYNFGVQAIYSDGASDIIEVSSVDAEGTELITATGLKSIYPNPFNPEVNIEFALAESEKVLLEIYNIKGQKIRTLVNETFRPDTYNIIWKGDNESGYKVSSGVYFVKLKIDSEVLTNKVILLK